MKKVCAMAGIIFNPEKPGQSIHELKTVSICGVMFDFSIFISAESILRARVQGQQKWKPWQIEESYHKAIREFASHDFLPSIARLPLVSERVKWEDVRQCEELNRLTLQIDQDCIRACEEMGCEYIIIQPLSVGVEKGREWDVNRAFYLALASSCRKEETKLLLLNQCSNRNGHLIRGLCSDGAEAAGWIDALNKEAGMERFGFCLDVGYCNLCGQNIQTMTSALKDRIRAVILTENDGHTMARLLPFTSAYDRRSTLDWLGVIRGLREISYDGYLILETMDTTVAFSPLLQPGLFPLYSAILDYFEMQIHIERDLKKYKYITLFGAGNMCRNYMKCYGAKYPPLFTCDNNPKFWDTEFEGLPVKNPEELKKLPADSGVIICNIFYKEIAAQLRSMGIENIGYFNDEYMPSFYYDRIKREEEFEKNASSGKDIERK